MDKISLQAIVGNLTGNMNVTNVNRQLPDIARWAFEAIRKIGSNNSYVHKECLLEVKNNKTKLPCDFVYLNGLKYNNHELKYTNRTFKLFHKGQATFDIPEEMVCDINRAFSACTPGVASVDRITFGGVFVAGDVIVITISVNNCGDLSTHTINYVVDPADNVNTIAANIAAELTLITGAGFTAVASGPTIDITALSPEVIINITEFTDSVAGTISIECITKRVPPKKNDDKNLANNGIVPGPDKGSPHLANRTVHKLNTGINATGSSDKYNEYNSIGNTGVTASVFAIANGWLHFNCVDGTEIGISYEGIDVDKEGWPMIHLHHEDAVTHYIQFMMISKRYWDNKVPEHTYRNAERRWKELCGQARGDDNMPDREELIYLSNIWNQLIPLPDKNNF